MYLYCHVPFCRSRCIYCDFYVVLEKYGGKQAFVEGLIRELDQRFSQPNVPLSPIETLYVGGGTPSLLSARDYNALFEAFLKYTRFTDAAEITLEANPEAMVDAPEAYLAAGFNRISVGVQTLHDTELKRLSRIHTAEQATAFVKRLATAGFKNISIDLMYNLPGQTLHSWQETLNRALDLPIQHVSMYGLKVEETTPLARLVTMGAYVVPDDEANVAMYETGCQRLEAAGFGQYEISNFARPGFESRHNLNYWNNGPFVALGPSATGYYNSSRYETVRDVVAWLKNPLAGNYHKVTEAEALENAIVFGLRKREGIDIAAIEALYGIDFEQQYGWIVDKYTPYQSFERFHGRLRLSQRAIPVSNAVLLEFVNA